MEGFFTESASNPAIRVVIDAKGNVVLAPRIGGPGASITFSPGDHRIEPPLLLQPGKGAAGPDGAGPDGQVIIEGPATFLSPCGESVSWSAGRHHLTSSVPCPCGEHLVIEYREPG